MVKGVNRKIIEINNPDSLYFEKAVLYLKPNITFCSDTISHKEAQKLIQQLTSDDHISQRRKRIKKFLLLSLAIIAAAAIIIFLI